MRTAFSFIVEEKIAMKRGEGEQVDDTPSGHDILVMLS
jgi:hypothetical protein